MVTSGQRSKPSYFRIIGYWDGTNNNGRKMTSGLQSTCPEIPINGTCRNKFCENASQRVRKAPYKCWSKGQVKLGHQVKMYQMSCNTCLFGHLERGIRIRHSFLYLIRGKFVKVRSNCQILSTKYSFKGIPFLYSFISAFLKCHLFWRTCEY